MPAMAERTTMRGSSPVVMRRATFLIRSAEPTEVPPNFNTFMWVMFLGG